jgi:POT family proton-dependent oligopeptide transporter
MTSITLTQEQKTNLDKSWFGHPRGLFVLFFTEMWERFSYYGMRALLVLYMTKYLFDAQAQGKYVFGFESIKHAIESVFGPLTNQALSSQIYGLYTGFVYFTPFFGGILADKILGQRKSVVLGGVLMAIGHFLMAIESMFFPALLFLILGNGCFKPNISTQVGNLYSENDPRRDSAFTIFYMGINLGAFFSPLVCGTLGQKVGWHYGFGAAGVGMIIGLIIYLWGQKYLPKDRIMKQKESHEDKKEPLTPQEWKSVWALIFLCIVNIFFWGIFEQQGNTLQLWADERTDWNFLGLEIPSTWYQSFNPAMIFIFAPLMNIFWGFQAKKNKEPSSVTKMAIGCFLCGAAYIVMILASHVVPENQKGSVMWLTFTTWLFTMGELYLSPIGLSLVTKVAPAKIVSMMMGMWFLSSFFGNYVAGWIGSYYERMPKDMFFLMLVAMGFIAGFIFLASKKTLHNVIGKDV